MHSVHTMYALISALYVVNTTFYTHGPLIHGNSRHTVADVNDNMPTQIYVSCPLYHHNINVCDEQLRLETKYRYAREDTWN